MKASQNIKNTVASTMFDEIVEHYNSHASLAENAYLQPRMEHITSKKEQFLATINVAKPKLTREGEDKSRGFYFQSLYASLKGYSSLLIEKKKAAAEYFLEIINRHGGKKISSLPYDEETSTLFSVEKEFGTEEAKEKLAQLDGIEELAQKVFEANKAVKDLSVKNEKSSAGQKSEESATAIKKYLLNYLNEQILTYLTWAKNSEGAEVASFADEVFATISKANASTAKKAKKQPQAVSQGAETTPSTEKKEK